MAKNSPAAAGLAGIVRRQQTQLDRLSAQVVRPEVVQSSYERTARGLIAPRQRLTANSAAYSANTTTDFTLAALSVSADRAYNVHLSTQWALSAAGSWIVNLADNGTVVDRFVFIDETASERTHLHGVLPWEPTAGVHTLDVRLVKTAGAAGITLTFEASTTPPNVHSRWFWVEDAGPRLTP